MRKFLILLTILACLLAGCSRDEAAATPPETGEAPKAVILETNPYTAEDFRWEEDRLVCRSGEAITGIDVSVHQGPIDWAAVAADDIAFAMVRVGYRGSDDGQLWEDVNARANLEGALAAGLDVGVYFFSQALTPEEARQEAQFVLDYIAGYDITMPVVFDWEHVEDPEARTAAMFDRELLTDCALAFLEPVQAAGYRPMIYFNSYQSNELLDLWLLRRSEFWFALYDGQMNFPWEIAMWQYTDKGQVDGIKGKVDLNLYFP